METKTEPTLETMTKEMEKIMPASKPSPKGKALLEQLNTMTPGVDDTQQPAVSARAAGKSVTPKPVAIIATETKPPSNPTQEGAEKPFAPLVELTNLLARTPKEHLPTMMVRIANKCLAEKVFASPGAMAEAIVGASRGK